MRQTEHDVYVSAGGIELRVDDPEHDDLVTLLEKLRKSQLLGVVVGSSRGHGPDMLATVTEFEQREFAQSEAASIFGNALVELGFADGIGTESSGTTPGYERMSFRRNHHQAPPAKTTR